MSILSSDDITQAEHYTKQTLVKRWLIFMLYINTRNRRKLLSLVPAFLWQKVWTMTKNISFTRDGLNAWLFTDKTSLKELYMVLLQMCVSRGYMYKTVCSKVLYFRLRAAHKTVLPPLGWEGSGISCIVLKP